MIYEWTMLYEWTMTYWKIIYYVTNLINKYYNFCYSKILNK